jgi:hypothetical protein
MPQVQKTTEEVNDYLARAIDARSVQHLRDENCHALLLTFKDAKVESLVGSII